jgi:hypothetical protein
VSDINAAAEAFTGEWRPLTKKEHGIIEGRVTYFETRPATYEGQPQLSRKTGLQRTEWVIAVLQDDGETVKFSTMESGQRAISAAIKASGQPAKNGDRIKIAVTKDSVQGKEQADYKVVWTPDATPLNIPVAASVTDEEPF